MRRSASFLTAIAAIALALAPALADARPGGGSSSGSRGSRTYSAPPPTNTAPGQARSFDRTTAPQSQPGLGQPGVAQPRPPIGQPNPAGGFFSRNPLMAGMMGGLLGAGLFGLLAGHGLFGGLHGMAGMFGLLLQIGLIALLAMLAIRLFRGMRSPAMAGGPAPGPGMMAREMQGGGRMPGGPAMGVAPGALARGPARPSAEFPLEAGDFQAFEGLLQQVNAAWSRQDLGTLRRIATPEMADYFAQDLSDLAARGWTNETRDVRLEQGDMAESWREGARDWATVAMRFSMIDVTRRLSDGAVVEGDAERRTESTELWTFVRPTGGQWILSAIQQTG